MALSPNCFAGCLFDSGHFLMIMNGDRVDAMDSSRDGWNVMQWIAVAL
jgi:hypothetical protein